MSVSPQDLREVRSPQQVPSPAHYQRSHISVPRRVVPTGTAARDAGVPRWRARSAVGGGAGGGSAHPGCQEPIGPSRVLLKSWTIQGSLEDAGPEQPFAQNTGSAWMLGALGETP